MFSALERFIWWLAPESALKRDKARRELQHAVKLAARGEEQQPKVDPWLRDDRGQRSIERPELF